MTVNEIAQKIGSYLGVETAVIGDGETGIHGVAAIEEAGEGEISFVSNPKYLKYLESTNASAVIISASLDDAALPAGEDVPVFIRVGDPYAAFVCALRLFNPPREIIPPGIHPAALVAESVSLEEGVRVGAYAVIGERCRIGAGSVIAQGTIIGDGVSVGKDTVLYPNVTVRENCSIGSRVIIHPGAVIGSDGFGFAPQKNGTYVKVPQTGIVVIEDDVEIGSNCTIDRATLGETRIGKGVKLDNLIQIAHNVTVGENTVIAAQSGVSGSTRIGKQCILAGQVGIVGHVEIADNTIITAQSGVSKGIKKSGTYFGSPAKEMGRATRIEVIIRRLPEIAADLEEIKKELNRLKELRGDRESGEDK